MNADQDNFKHKELTDKIIKAFYTVYNKLGYGFLEKVYVNALIIDRIGKIRYQCHVSAADSGSV